jgi:iron(III) transport system substrate-binding protein
MLVPSRLAVACAAAFSLAAANALAQTPAGYPSDYQKIIDGAKKEGTVVIYSTTDTKTAEPVIKGFETAYPGVKVEYNDMNSTELYNRFISEQASGGNSGDVVWSSSMDSALQLAKDYALQYKSPEQGKLPSWAVWKDAAYGTTYEPAVFIYNKRLVPQADVPKTHGDLAKLVAAQTDKFKNKVTTYDIEKSAVGFMLAVQDKANDPHYFDTVRDTAKGGLVVQSSTGTMMERVSSGENLIGYNILGSYAEARARKDSSIGIVYPADYTLVLSRVAFISKKSKHRNAAKLWLDYLLSQKGQEIVATKADMASIRDDVHSENDVQGLTQKLGKALKPIPVNDSLLEYLQQKKRLEFINEWRKAAGK